MKVILANPFTFPYHGYGGSQRFVYLLGKYLAKRKIDVEIVTRAYDVGKFHTEIYDNLKYVFLPVTVEGHRYRQISTESDVRINDAPIGRFKKIRIIRGFVSLYKRFKFWKSLSSYLQNSNADIVHAFSDSPLLYLLKKKRKPVLLTLFDIGNRGLSRKKLTEFRGRNDIASIISTYCTELADAVSTCGPDYTKELTDILDVPSRKIVYIPNGVAVDSILENVNRRTLWRKDLGLDDNDFVLISVNRLGACKRVGLILNAFIEVKKLVPNGKLIIIGVGPLEEQIRGIIQQSGLGDDILWFRNVSDSQLHNYLLLSDVFINAAITRYMLLTVMEAMACCLPIITTTPLDGIVVSGENGYVIETSDPAVIAETIINMLEEDDMLRMGKRSFTLIKNYTWEEVAEKSIKAYRRIIMRGEKGGCGIGNEE